jgi:hypothetical protein
MEICTGIDLKCTKFAIELNLREEITETKLVAEMFVLGVTCHIYRGGM